MIARELADELFSPHNLPYGVFSSPGSTPRVGVRLGTSVIDLHELLDDPTFAEPALDRFMGQGLERWREVRSTIVDRLDDELPPGAVHALEDVVLHRPFTVGDYVDFYASEHHAMNLGRLFRPDSEPLMPNWKHLPVGYHGRGGTVVVSGTDVVRPSGQQRAPGEDAPTFGPSQRLDIEAELGFVVGSGSELAHAVSVDDFEEHVFGVVLVNDWSARDLQAWEYVPLGPHLGKSFATSISAWVTPLAALDHARIPLPEQQPEPLPYLRATHPTTLDIDLLVAWNDVEVSRPPYRSMYWSPAQMLAHLTINGASTRTGDLFASGTVSGPGRAECGAFIELTWGGRDPVAVAGEQRTFLEDGDEIVISATAPGPGGTRVGLGEVSGRVRPPR